MKTIIKAGIVHPMMDSAKSITGETIPATEDKYLVGEVGIDSHGRLIFRSDESIKDRFMTTPFDDISFITIDKTDAQNLYDMITWAMEQIKPGNQEYKDIDVFGPRAISYERLYDYLNGEDYHIKKNEESGS